VYRTQAPLSGTALDDLLTRARQGATDTLQKVLASTEDFRLATCPSKQLVIQTLGAWITSQQGVVTAMASARADSTDAEKIQLDGAISQVSGGIKVCQQTLDGMKQGYARDCPGAAGGAQPATSTGLVVAACVALGITAYFVIQRK
jgi:hypothetical protein